MKSFHFPLLAATVMACALSSSAQQPTCPLKQAPEFNGFHLGMTAPDVRAKITDADVFDSKLSAANKIGAQAVQILGTELKDEYAEGIDDLNLTFVDRRLAVIKATFNGAMTWRSAQDFFKQVGGKLGLPQDSSASTTRGTRGNEKYRFECADFAVTLAYSFGVSPSVTISNTVAQKLVDERSEKNPDVEVKTITTTPTIRTTRPRQPKPPPPR